MTEQMQLACLHIYSSKENIIQRVLPLELIQWPLVINGEEQWITVEVEE